MQKHAYRWLLQQAKSVKLWVGLSVGVSLFSGLLLILQAFLLAFILNQVYIHHYSRLALFNWLSGLLAVMIARAGLAWVREITSFKSSATVRLMVRERLVQHILKLGPVNLAQFNTGTITTRVVEVVEGLHGFFANYLPQLSLCVLLPVVILFAVFPVNWLAGLVLLISAPLIPLFMALIGMGVASLNKKQFQSLAYLSSQFLDLLQGLVTLKLFNQSRQRADAIASAADEYRQRTMSVLRVAFMSSGVLELFSSVAIAILAVFLGLSLLGKIHVGNYAHSITLTNALFILLLAPEFFLPLRRLAVHYHARAEAVAAAEEINEILTLSSDDHQGNIQLNSIPTICFKQIDFAYQQQKVLQKVELMIKPGDHIAIIGPSGAGKTTLLMMLLGFIQPQLGEIYLDEHRFSDIDIQYWRSQIAWLGQQPRLMNASIYENIRLAKLDATENEINEAANTAHVMDFVKRFPQGLHTIVGEQNMGLSGGQVQRIALARMILANKPIILLDEPTAALDSDTEQLILNELSQFSKNKTLITVSHRQSTIVGADKIYYLQNGQLRLLTHEQQGDVYA